MSQWPGPVADDARQGVHQKRRRRNEQRYRPDYKDERNGLLYVASTTSPVRCGPADVDVDLADHLEGGEVYTLIGSPLPAAAARKWRDRRKTRRETALIQRQSPNMCREYR